MSVQIYLILFFSLIFVTTIVSGIISYYLFKKEYQKRLSIDISIEQMLELENRISDFLNHHNMKPGEPIQKIAKALNIVEGGVQNGIHSRARLNEPNESGEMVVVFKTGLNEKERLFDFAHECGHRINHDPVPVTRPEGYNKDECEQLADYVGAALLLPLDNLYKFLQDHKYIERSRREKRNLIKKICAKYNVSEMIALRRINEIYIIKTSNLGSRI